MLRVIRRFAFALSAFRRSATFTANRELPPASTMTLKYTLCSRAIEQTAKELARLLVGSTLDSLKQELS
jgi:hypothetical protein